MIRKSNSKKSLKMTHEGIEASLNSKNNMIAILKTETEQLRMNHENYDRIKQKLFKIKDNYQNLLSDYEILKTHHTQKLQASNKSIFELKVHLDHLGAQLNQKSQALKQSKQQLQEVLLRGNRQQDELTDIQISIQELRNQNQMYKLQEERSRVQLISLQDEYNKNKKEVDNIIKTIDHINEKCHKTQNYMRNLVREEANLTEELSKIEDENNYRDQQIGQIQMLTQLNITKINQNQKEYEETKFNIISKQIEKKKLKTQIKETIRCIAIKKEQQKMYQIDMENKSIEVNKFNHMIKDSSEQSNEIQSKNNQISEINAQLKQDLEVCNKHFENISRVNKNMQQDIIKLKNINLKTIKKLQQPFKQQDQNQKQIKNIFNGTGKWSMVSRCTNAENTYQ